MKHDSFKLPRNNVNLDKLITVLSHGVMGDVIYLQGDGITIKISKSGIDIDEKSINVAYTSKIKIDYV